MYYYAGTKIVINEQLKWQKMFMTFICMYMHMYIHTYAHICTHTQYDLNYLKCILYAQIKMKEIHKSATVIISGWRKYGIVGILFFSLSLTVTFSRKNMYCFYNQKKKTSEKTLLTNSTGKPVGSLCWSPHQESLNTEPSPQEFYMDYFT